MPGIDELSRAIGKLESSVDTLFHKNDILCKDIKALTKALQNRRLWDTVKVVTGAAIGGVLAMLGKMAKRLCIL